MWRALGIMLGFAGLSVVIGCGGDGKKSEARDYQCELCTDRDTAQVQCDAILEESDCSVGVSVVTGDPTRCSEESTYCVFHECGEPPPCEVPDDGAGGAE